MLSSLPPCCLLAGFCKQQLWPLFHYILPLSTSSTGRFDADLWQAYVKANKARAAGKGLEPLPLAAHGIGKNEKLAHL
jgi:hypothetical protein